MSLNHSRPVSPDHNMRSNNSSSTHDYRKIPSQTEEARLQILWDEKMQYQPKFVHYDKVAVLMLSWDDTCDDLKTSQEVDELSHIFQEMYGFVVRKEKLKPKQKAQTQMTKHLINLVSDFEDENSNNLLIIYYAGHGWSKLPDDADQRRKELWLSGNTTYKAQKQVNRNTIMWGKAEENILGVDAEVFLIFDCCYSGLIGRSNESKRFETLAACPEDRRTHIPGKTSFTAALIWALRELRSRRDRPFFTSSELRTTVMECPDFPDSQVPQLNDRVHSRDHIVIAPSDTKPSCALEAKQEDVTRPVRTSYIDLRLHFDDDCDHEKIADVANLFRKLKGDGQLCTHRIDFLGKNAVWKSKQWRVAADLGVHWFEHTQRQKRRRLSSIATDKSQLLAPTMLVSPAMSVAVSEDFPEDLSVD